MRATVTTTRAGVSVDGRGAEGVLVGRCDPPMPIVRGVLIAIVLVSPGLAGACLPAQYGDRGFGVPLVLQNSLNDSVRAVLELRRNDREFPDSITILDIWLGPGEVRRTRTCFGSGSLTSAGVPSSRPYVLTVSTDGHVLWEARLTSSWIDTTELRVRVEPAGPGFGSSMHRPKPGYRAPEC
jgi:hypothetical protein